MLGALQLNKRYALPWQYRGRAYEKEVSNMKKERTPLTNSNFGLMGWTLVIFYFFALFMDVGISADGAQIVIPAISAATGWNPSTLLYFNSIAGYVALIAYIPIGIWAQKRSPKTQATVLSILAGIAYLLLGRATSIPMYAVCLVLAVVCSNGRCWISYAKLTSNWFPRKKGIVMGWTTIGNNASTMLLVPLLVAMIGFGGISFATTVLGIFMIVTGILNQILVKDTPESCGHYPDNITPEQERQFGLEPVSSTAADEPGKWTTVKILCCKEFWIIALACALMMCGNVGCVAYSTVRIQEFGFTQAQAVLINAVFAALACFGSIVWGWMDQKFGTQKAVVLFCIVFGAAAFINVAASFAGHNLILMFISVFMFYWCIGGNANWPVSLCASLFDRSDFLKAQTPLTVVFTAGRMTAFSVIAFGMSLTGGTMDGAYIICGVLFVLAMILMLFLNVPKFKEKYR